MARDDPLPRSVAYPLIAVISALLWLAIVLLVLQFL